MNRKSALKFVLLIFLLINVPTLLYRAEAIQPDDRSLYWERFDVTISEIDTSTNSFLVVEDYVLSVDKGPFSYGFVEIPLDRLENITDVTVYENHNQLHTSCENAAGTMCVEQDNNNLYIQYYFSTPLESSDTRSIRIQYNVHGGLRSYPSADELFWTALPYDLAFPVEASKVTVTFPEETVIYSVISYPPKWQFTACNNTFSWDSLARLSNDESFEIHVKFAHNPAMPKPDWQENYDNEQFRNQYDEDAHNS